MVYYLSRVRGIYCHNDTSLDVGEKDKLVKDA